MIIADRLRVPQAHDQHGWTSRHLQDRVFDPETAFTELQAKLIALEGRVEGLDVENKGEHEDLQDSIIGHARTVAIGGLRLQAFGLLLVTLGALVAAVPSLTAG